MEKKSKTIYGLTDAAGAVIKGRRKSRLIVLICIGLTTAVGLGFSLYDLLRSKPVDGDLPIVYLALIGMMVLVYLVVSHGGNYTVSVKFGDEACEIEDVKSKTVVPYNRVKTVEVFENLKCSRGLYYQFLLLAGDGGRELGLIQQSIKDFDRLAIALSARCESFGAAVLPVNDNGGPGRKLLEAKSGRTLRIIGLAAALFFLVLFVFSLAETRAIIDLRQNGVTVMADIYQYVPDARPCLRYKFQAADGKEHKGDFGMYFGRKKCESFSEPGLIPVKYLPSKPGLKAAAGEGDGLYLNIFCNLIFASLSGVLFLVAARRKCLAGHVLIRGVEYRFTS